MSEVIVPGLGDNILNLARLRRHRDTALANLSEPLRLKLVAPAEANPGELRMLTYVPPGLPDGAPLVVVLHGCTQNAAAYDHGSGWSKLAERHGFALLFPEQQRSNNSNLCLNWFQPEDIARGVGEAESIRQMVVQAIQTHRLDPRRVYVTGLSAGGAMTAVMLATAPELFAGGAIIAGLPYGSASSIPEALGVMRQPRSLSPAEWGAKVTAASTHRGLRPSVQIWHGTADSTVSPGNADALVRQWTEVLGLPQAPSVSDTVDGAGHEAWRGADGSIRLERFTVPGLGHGTPIGTPGADGDQATGVPGPHMLASSIDSTWHLARSWGLLTQAARPRASRPAAAAMGGQGMGAQAAAAARVAGVAAGAGSVVERALRAAGLMK